MFGVTAGGLIESAQQYRNFIRTFGKGTSPKEYGEYLASRGKKKKKRRGGGKRWQ